MWIPLDTLTLSSSWHYCPESEHGLYRLTALTEARSPTGNAITGRFDVGQFDLDGTGYGIRSFRRESFGVIFQLVKPPFFEAQRLGLRVPTGFYPFDLTVEVNDMPYSSLGNAAAATNVVKTIVTASVTAVVLAPADPDTKLLTFSNNSAKSLYLDYDGDVTGTDFADEVKANTKYEMPTPFSGEVKGIWATGATGTCKVVRFI
jgi:hypothetical protein